jgi:2-iminobutanoate/2-iminopropanoate deaminase
MSERHSLYVDGFGHANPIPAACRKGPLLMSGLINGTDPATGRMAETLEVQCANMFSHVRRILAAAGGTPADLVRMSVWLKDRANREPLNTEWTAMFPDRLHRPARLALHAPELTNGILVQCEISAWIETPMPTAA